MKKNEWLGDYEAARVIGEHGYRRRAWSDYRGGTRPWEWVWAFARLVPSALWLIVSELWTYARRRGSRRAH